MKKILSLLMVLVLCALTVCGCGKKEEQSEANVQSDVTVRVGSLKGPTSMGLVKLMEDSSNGESAGNYEFTMETQADALLPLVTSGELDIALVPANVASVLYAKTEGNISVIDINTLGVLYFVSGDASIESINDLEGRTVYLTGKGTTPDYVLSYILEANGIEGVTLEYKSEASEVASVLAADDSAVGFLPQPFATSAMMQNDSLVIITDASSEWDKLQGEGGSRLVTGVTIVNNDFLKENPEAVKTFLNEHKASAEFANTDVETASSYVEKYGIMEKAAVAAKAMPLCNITYIDGAEMKEALSGYLRVLYDSDPASVGGKLPENDFYYNAE